jgi:hypothetical protein
LVGAGQAGRHEPGADPEALRLAPNAQRLQIPVWIRRMKALGVGTEPGKHAKSAGRDAEHTQHRRAGSEPAGQAPWEAARRWPDRDTHHLTIADRSVDRAKWERVTHRGHEKDAQGALTLCRIGKDVPPGRVVGVTRGEHIAC